MTITSAALICLLSMFASTLAAANTRPDVAACKQRIEQQAIDGGATADTVKTLLAKADFDDKIIALDRRQPEFSSTFARYMSLRVTDTRVEKGRELYQQHRALLDKLQRQYGVPGKYLVAFWGLETNFGGYMGDYNVFDSLFTLSCDPRRSSFFTGELIQALKLVDEQGLDASSMVASWAGALGQTQFMPSNYRRFAIDGDGDGRADLWGSVPDALSSAAHFLNSLGWEPGLRWGREVRLPKDFDWAQAGRKNRQPLSHWRRLGVRDQFGNRLPARDDIEGAVIVPAGHRGPAFIAYKNFRVIMGWNFSEYYAISVGHLADRIAGGGAFKQQPPTDAPRLRRADIKAMQARLNALGFDAGKPDGIAGAGTRAAVRAFQIDRGMIGDGFLSKEVVALLLPATEKNND